MAWIVLVIAGLLEIVWSVAMKQSDGFTRLAPSVLSVTAMIGSVVALAFAMRTLPLGTAYTVWTGIGAVGTLTMGVLLFGETMSAIKLAGIALVLAGIAALKFAPS